MIDQQFNFRAISFAAGVGVTALILGGLWYSGLILEKETTSIWTVCGSRTQTCCVSVDSILQGCTVAENVTIGGGPQLNTCLQTVNNLPTLHNSGVPCNCDYEYDGAHSCKSECDDFSQRGCNWNSCLLVLANKNGDVCNCSNTYDAKHNCRLACDNLTSSGKCEPPP